MLKWFVRIVLALVVLGGIFYWWGFLYGDTPSGTFKLDIAELRQAASNVAGPKPVVVRMEHVASAHFPLMFTRVGGTFEATEMPFQSYQIAYEDGSTIVLETALTETQAKQNGADFFDPAAAARVNAAMTAAKAIVVTHEHWDHMGGLVGAPNLKDLMKTAVLNKEQATNTSSFAVPVPPGALEGYTPLIYEGVRGIAPGIVLIKAPGHTLGSQMVFVQRDDGKEFLFLGDVAWKLANVDMVVERPRLVTAVMGEDRQKVFAQLAAIKALKDANPDLHIMPGHDRAVLNAALKDGWLEKGFK